MCYLITVPNINKINLFFTPILQQIHNIYEKIIITQIWHRAKLYYIGISNTWYPITVPNVNNINIFFSEISQQTSNLWKNHNYSNMAQNQILVCVQQQPMVSDHGTKYKDNPSCYHRGMHKDGQTDWQTGPIPIFLKSTIVQHGIIKFYYYYERNQWMIMWRSLTVMLERHFSCGNHKVNCALVHCVS